MGATVLLLFAFLPAWAQSQPQALLPFVAIDHHGRPIADVTSDSLLLWDNKNPVSGAKLLHGADLPLRLGILIDTSNSQKKSEVYEPSVAALKDFVNQVVRLDQDRVFFDLFSVTSEATPLLSKSQLAGLSMPLQVGGGTALYNAIVLACADRMGKANWQNPVRRVILVLSDGEDNMSQITPAKAEAIAVSSGVMFFTISTNSSDRRSRGDSFLEAISKGTGGAAYTDIRPRDTQKLLAQIREQIDSMYYLTYVPPPNRTHDDMHNVEIRPAKGAKFELHAPKKYSWNP